MLGLGRSHFCPHKFNRSFKVYYKEELLKVWILIVIWLFICFKIPTHKPWHKYSLSGNTKFGITYVSSIGRLLCPTIQTQCHMRIWNFIFLLVKIHVVIHIDTKDNWTFCGYYSVILKTIFVEQNNLMCGCNKYGCGQSSSMSMLTNGYNFKLHSRVLLIINIVQLYNHIYIMKCFFFLKKTTSPIRFDDLYLI
jgi:hypothetical protein